MEVEIRVIKKITHIECECPNCKEDLKFEYSDFVDIVGEPCDWKDGKFICQECGHLMDIGSIDWD